MINGSRLRDLRKRQKITAEELGKILGVSGPQITRYETGQNDMTTEMLIQIADFFDVSTDYLLGRADMPNPYEYRRAVLSWRFNTPNMFQTFEPEFIARFLKATGIAVIPEPERIRISDLLKEHSPERVAAFVRHLTPNFRVEMDAPLPDENDDEQGETSNDDGTDL